MNEITSIKSHRYRDSTKEGFDKILERFGFRNFDYSKVTRKSFRITKTCFGLIGKILSSTGD
ncbi:hypothetical protein HanIR_Chr11g0556391 [Helianthus annuus]|nr:hypothetical protein HanIR_Chr11g0556391 [Helianthus annuus]